jgi:Zn-dependent peptidase ImmA (M78 family)/DNA-binding XRE family transcriptional regulator
MIGPRLKLARSAAGLSLRELEEKIGGRVTAQAIGKYERDESMPSSGVLIALADALGVSVDYLVGNQEMVLEAVEFRKKKITSRREESQVEAKVLHMLERYLMVEELLHLPSVEWDKPREAPYPIVQNVSEADHAAHSLRDHWGLGNDPIPNLVELLEERGIKVLSVELTNIDGLTAQVCRAQKGAVPVIVVNRRDWGERQRFTLGHELGHMVMEVSSKVDEEKAAHRFAGAFLMPAEALWAEVGRHRTSIGWEELFYLKQLFGVSVQALTYRCKDLGIFSQTLFRRLFNDFSRLGWRSPPYEEPFARAEGESPKRYERLTFRALAEGAISEAKAAELLDMSVRELTKRMEEPPPIQRKATAGS